MAGWPAMAGWLPPSQFGFLKGTGAQDCGAAMAFTATQALEDRQECRIVSLDIRGAFDSVIFQIKFYIVICFNMLMTLL